MARKKALDVKDVVRALAMKYEGKSYDEIAKVLGCGRVTVARWVPLVESLIKKYYAETKMSSGKAKTSDPFSVILRKLDELNSEIKEIKELLKKSGLTQESR